MVILKSQNYDKNHKYDKSKNYILIHNWMITVEIDKLKF